MLLIVMYETGTWRAKPAQRLTFGRAATCDVVLPNEDRGVSRNAGSLDWRHGAWWLTNSSASSMLYLTGDRGFRADIPPGMGLPLQQWHAKVRLDGVLDSYTLRIRLPDLDEAEEDEAAADHEVMPERQVTSTRLRAPLSDADRLVLAARFEDYLTWKHSGVAVPRSARDAAARIGWDAHAVSKRCENIRNRYVRIGVPGLRGPRALEELAALLISTGELTTDDLRRLPPMAARPTAGVTPAPAAARPAPAAARPAPVSPGPAGPGSASPASAGPGSAAQAAPAAPTPAGAMRTAPVPATPTPAGVTPAGVTPAEVRPDARTPNAGTPDAATPTAEPATPSASARP
jgi:hypothetical protein